MSKVMFVIVAVVFSLGLVGSRPTQASAGPPCAECIDELNACLDAATSSFEESQCLVEFRVCRVAC